MRNDATSIDTYLASMPPERRAAVEAVRALVNAHLPDGYIEALNWGMIAWEVPLETSGPTYNGKPLMYAALASQKNHMGLYLCGVYCVPNGKEDLRRAFAASGRWLDMGQACLRFRTLDDLDLNAVAACIAAVTPAQLVAASDAAPRKRKPSKRKS